MSYNGVVVVITEPTDWCSPIVPVLKKNGDVRVYVDLKRVNKARKQSA